MEMDDGQATILVIDDDEDILKMLTDLLSKRGYITDTARTGAEAIEKMKARPFNIAALCVAAHLSRSRRRHGLTVCQLRATHCHS